MPNSDSKSSVINNDLIKHAFLFISQELQSSLGIKIHDSKSLTDHAKKTTNLLLLYFSYLIFQNKRKSASLALFDKLMRKHDLTEAFCYSEFTLKIDVVDKFRRIFEFCNELSVEDIGYIYDEIHKFQFQVTDNELKLVISSKDKKKKGSFYTPAYIVDYIIENTLGIKLDSLKKKHSKSKSDLDDSIRKLRVFDPSVGGGIFLIRSTNFLRRWLSENFSNEKKQNNDLLNSFVTDCLFGNDINTVACDITNISLMLLLSNSSKKVLQRNVKCKNSIDCLMDEPKKVVSNSDQNSKFDIIISNPPFQYGENNPFTKTDFSKKFRYSNGQYDVYWLFYELAFRKLLKKGGYHGYIIPDAILIRDGASVLRQNLLKKKIYKIWHVGAVFEQLHVSSVVLIWQNIRASKQHKIEIHDEKSDKWKVNQTEFNLYDFSKFLIYINSNLHQKLINKLQAKTSTVKNIAEIHRGEELGKKGLKSVGTKDTGVLTGQEILPYKIESPKLFISDKSKLRKLSLYKGDKVLIRKTGADLVAGFSKNRQYFLQSVYCLQIVNTFKNEDKRRLYLALLGIMNSRLINFYIHNTFTAYKLIYPQLNQTTILQIPLPDDFIDKDWSNLIELVQKRIKSTSTKIETIEADIDEIIYSAYNLDQDEISLVNKHQTSLSFKR